MSTQTIDFSRSFVTFRIDMLKKTPITYTHQPPTSLNNARIQIDCLLDITEKETGRTEQFVLGANCKTERVGVERNIWTKPNADFVPVYSSKQFLNIKTYDHVGQTVPLYPPTQGDQLDRQVGLIEEAYDDLRINLVCCQAETLQESEGVVQATLENDRITATTEIETDRYHVVIDYPVKSMNVNERDISYQPDTGPVLLPNLESEWDQLIEGLELAFVAFNCPNWAEFIVRQPTPLGNGSSVWHYCDPRRLEVTNRLFRLIETAALPMVSRSELKPHFLKSGVRS